VVVVVVVLAASAAAAGETEIMPAAIPAKAN
jgi:hypothetical protein